MVNEQQIYGNRPESKIHVCKAFVSCKGVFLVIPTFLPLPNQIISKEQKFFKGHKPNGFHKRIEISFSRLNDLRLFEFIDLIK